MPRTTLTKVRNESKTTTTYDPDSSFYATRKWTNFRARHKADQARKDIALAKTIHKKNPSVTGLELTEFIASGQPLCQHFAKENIIRIAEVLDHINPIRQGGSVWDTKNLQWLSYEAHNIKRAKEGHQSRTT